MSDALGIPATIAASQRFIRPTEIPWEARPLTSLQAAAAICGVSPATLYKFQTDGKLVFKRLGGRTLIETASLVALVNAAEAWRPSNQTGVATCCRIERARASRRR